MLGRLVVPALAALVLAGCGNSGSSGASTKNLSPAQRERAEYPACAKATKPVLTDLQHLDSKLDVGMVIGDYRTAVGSLNAKFDDLKAKHLSGDCARDVRSLLGEAVHAHIRAVSTWNECIQDDCDTSYDPQGKKMQNNWRVAGQKIASVKAVLQRMKEGVSQS